MTLLDVTDREAVAVECLPTCRKCGKVLNKEDAKSPKRAERPCRRCRKKERQESNEPCPAEETKINDISRVQLMGAFYDELKVEVVAEVKANGEHGALQRVIGRRVLEGRPVTCTDLMARRPTSLTAHRLPVGGEQPIDDDDSVAFTKADMTWHLELVRNRRRRIASPQEGVSC